MSLYDIISCCVYLCHMAVGIYTCVHSCPFSISDIHVQRGVHRGGSEEGPRAWCHVHWGQRQIRLQHQNRECRNQCRLAYCVLRCFTLQSTVSCSMCTTVCLCWMVVAINTALTISTQCNTLRWLPFLNDSPSLQWTYVAPCTAVSAVSASSVLFA